MAQRTTRNKIRWQGKQALEDLARAQDHLAGIAGIADERSTHISENLPPIMAALEMVREAAARFYEGL